MAIWVDADACPRVIKDILFRAAVRTEQMLTLVANQVATGLALTIFGTGVTLRDGSLALARYLGREEVSLRAMDFARRNGAGLIAAYDRGLLADLSWQARDSQIAIAAAPHAGSPRHHWDLVLPLDPALAGPVVLLQRGAPPACATGPVENWTAGPGFAEGRAFSLSLATPACLKASARD